MVEWLRSQIRWNKIAMTRWRCNRYISPWFLATLRHLDSTHKSPKPRCTRIVNRMECTERWYYRSECFTACKYRRNLSWNLILIELNLGLWYFLLFTIVKVSLQTSLLSSKAYFFFIILFVEKCNNSYIWKRINKWMMISFSSTTRIHWRR